MVPESPKALSIYGTSKPKGIHLQGISRIFVFFVEIFDRVRALKKLTTGITKNKNMSNKS